MSGKQSYSELTKEIKEEYCRFHNNPKHLFSGEARLNHGRQAYESRMKQAL